MNYLKTDVEDSMTITKRMTAYGINEYVDGLQELETVDEQITQFKDEIMSTLEKWNREYDKCLHLIKVLDERDDLNGGRESKERRRYTCRKEFLAHKLSDISKGIDILRLVLKD